MGISELRALLETLKEFGVTKYAAGDVSLELGGSIGVFKHDGTPAKEPREPGAKIDAELMAKFKSLPAAYQQAFTLGQD